MCAWFEGFTGQLVDGLSFLGPLKCPLWDSDRWIVRLFTLYQSNLDIISTDMHPLCTPIWRCFFVLDNQWIGKDGSVFETLNQEHCFWGMFLTTVVRVLWQWSIHGCSSPGISIRAFFYTIICWWYPGIVGGILGTWPLSGSTNPPCAGLLTIFSHVWWIHCWVLWIPLSGWFFTIFLEIDGIQQKDGEITIDWRSWSVRWGLCWSSLTLDLVFSGCDLFLFVIGIFW